MRLTVIPSDSVIILDGEVLKFPFVALPNLHAIQWHDTYGYIEYIGGKQVKTVDLADVQGFVTAFNAEKARLAEPKPPKTPAELEAEASAVAKKTIAEVRADIFPDLLDFVASLPSAPANIKAARDRVNAEKLKVR